MIIYASYTQSTLANFNFLQVKTCAKLNKKLWTSEYTLTRLKIINAFLVKTFSVANKAGVLFSKKDQYQLFKQGIGHANCLSTVLVLASVLNYHHCNMLYENTSLTINPFILNCSSSVISIDCSAPPSQTGLSLMITPL